MMHVIRVEMRALAQPEMSVPQFRVLAHVSLGTNTISALADLHSISLPAMSKIVDGMVKRGLITRLTNEKDRRVIVLTLTRDGKKAHTRVARGVEKKIVDLLEDVPAKKCKALVGGLNVIETIFT